MAIRTKRTLAVMALAAVAVLLIPATVQAQPMMIKVSDDINMKFGIQMQAWGDWAEQTGGTPATTTGYAENLYLRRIRLIAGGQVAPNVTFFFETDDPNLGKASKVAPNTSTFSSGFIVQDAMIDWKISEAFRLDGGLLIVPLSREGMQSTGQYFSLDVSGTATSYSAPTEAAALRDTGVMVRGNLLDRGQLEYRVMVSQGCRSNTVPCSTAAGSGTGARNAFRATGFLGYNFFEADDSYVPKGTQLGARKVLMLSGGWDTQSSYNAYDANLFWTLPIANGNEFGGTAMWMHYDGQSWISLPQQNNYMGQLAYLFGPAKTQPFVKYENYKYSQSALQNANNHEIWDAGLNYYVAKQNLKLTAQYQRVLWPSISGKPSTNEFMIQMQLFYF
jgi:hypothetical protein